MNKTNPLSFTYLPFKCKSQKKYTNVVAWLSIVCLSLHLWLKISMFEDPITQDTNEKKIEFHHSKIHRRQDVARKRKIRKIEWMRKMYICVFKVTVWLFVMGAKMGSAELIITENCNLTLCTGMPRVSWTLVQNTAKQLCWCTNPHKERWIHSNKLNQIQFQSRKWMNCSNGPMLLILMSN